MKKHRKRRKRRVPQKTYEDTGTDIGCNNPGSNLRYSRENMSQKHKSASSIGKQSRKKSQGNMSVKSNRCGSVKKTTSVVTKRKETTWTEAIEIQDKQFNRSNPLRRRLAKVRNWLNGPRAPKDNKNWTIPPPPSPPNPSSPPIIHLPAQVTREVSLNQEFKPNQVTSVSIGFFTFNKSRFGMASLLMKICERL